MIVEKMIDSKSVNKTKLHIPLFELEVDIDELDIGRDCAQLEIAKLSDHWGRVVRRCGKSIG